MANTLMKRFQFLDDLPDHFEERMQELEHQVVQEGGANPLYLASWPQAMNAELRRKVYELTSLSKEIREHMKLMMDLRERVMKFDLTSEYLNLFMAHFREAAYELAVGRVAANPRMVRAFES